MSYTPNYDLKVKFILDPLSLKLQRAGAFECTCALTGEKWMMTEEEISWYKKFNVIYCLPCYASYLEQNA